MNFLRSNNSSNRNANNRDGKKSANAGVDADEMSYESVCKELALSSSLELCEVCPDAREFLGNVVGATDEDRATWKGDVWKDAKTKPIGKKHKSVVEVVQMLPDWKGRGAPMLKWKAKLHLGDNPELFFDLLDNFELRRKWDNSINTIDHGPRLPAFDGLANVGISRSTTKAVLKGLVSPREFCSAVVRIRDIDAGIFINAAHGLGDRMQSTKYPVSSSFVRASMYFWSACLIKDADESGVWNLSMFIQLSVNGWVPRAPVISETILVQKNYLVYVDKLAQSENDDEALLGDNNNN